jgi:CoA binding protein
MISSRTLSTGREVLTFSPSKNMKHMTRQQVVIMQLLNRTRTIAVVGASPRPERHSHTVVSYLHRVGYDVIPVRLDLQPVDGLKSYAQLADIPVQLDLAVIFRRADAVPTVYCGGSREKGRGRMAAAGGLDASSRGAGPRARRAPGQGSVHRGRASSFF